MHERRAHVERITKETKIVVDLDLDGSGRADVRTGVGFFDHMLNSFARHGFFDLYCYVEGDLDVDCHHTIEDTGIVLGQAIAEAVGDKKGIRRYGNFLLPPVAASSAGKRAAATLPLPTAETLRSSWPRPRRASPESTMVKNTSPTFKVLPTPMRR